MLASMRVTMMLADHAVVAEGTERLTKYTGSIGLAIWQLDRFVSADAGSDGGVLTTVPLTFTGKRLELNVRNAPTGDTGVALLDASGHPIAGFEESDPVTGDNLRATVTWKGNGDVSALAGKPVSLRFTMKQAELFSFAFRK